MYQFFNNKNKFSKYLNNQNLNKFSNNIKSDFNQFKNFFFEKKTLKKESIFE